MMVYGGIEGGATCSKMVILDGNGRVLGRSEGPHTNHVQIGFEETARRIAELTVDAIKDAGLPGGTRLKTIGLGLSGLDTREHIDHMQEAVTSLNPPLAQHVYACNDSVASWATATDDDAIVLIAGTGSICIMMYKNMKFLRVGGYGHFLGDDGSAFWIARKAVNLYLRCTEGLHLPAHNMRKTREVILTHFGVKKHTDVSSFFNEKFNKTFIAKLCASLAQAAHDGDLMCNYLFYLAGVKLGRHVATALKKVDKALLLKPGGFMVVCCGSVFKSWDLLEKGFRIGLRPLYTKDVRRGKINLYLVETTAAFGATVLGAKFGCGTHIPRPEKAIKLIAEIDLEMIRINAVPLKN